MDSDRKPSRIDLVVEGIQEALASGPKTAEEVLKLLRKSKKAPKGDALPQVRYFLAQRRDLFEKVPGQLGVYCLKV